MLEMFHPTGAFSFFHKNEQMMNLHEGIVSLYVHLKKFDASSLLILDIFNTEFRENYSNFKL